MLQKLGFLCRPAEGSCFAAHPSLILHPQADLCQQPVAEPQRWGLSDSLPCPGLWMMCLVPGIFRPGEVAALQTPCPLVWTLPCPCGAAAGCTAGRCPAVSLLRLFAERGGRSAAFTPVPFTRPGPVLPSHLGFAQAPLTQLGHLWPPGGWL